MKTIVIHQEYADDYITRPAGERLRNEILQFSQQAKVCLDFQNKKVASVSFFDESLGKLVDEKWKREDFYEKIVLKNIYKLDLKVLNKILLDRDPLFEIERLL